ncbi:MAG TPA: hypothetical protein VLV78_19390 [Thermoanaerobaculia bacterium]|nr:hypothetical protein [Thermoanaerobaculia bacterium]
MSAAAEQNNFPTMIIPRGTEIKLNNHGQLSIKTPGNLVIQNSGNYSEIESTNGSIRIEENVSVEAVSVKAGQACYIQGTLTAWKVHAKRIALEDRAKAFIMVQESEHLELSKTARLVGNFANEKELYLMMGKFTSQLRELPAAVDMHSHAPLAETRAPQIPSTPPPPPPSAPVNPAADPDLLRAAQAILEREVARPDLAPAESEAVREVLYGLRERNLPRVSSIFREAFAELRTPSDSLKKAYEHLDRYFSPSKRSTM